VVKQRITTLCLAALFVIFMVACESDANRNATVTATNANYANPSNANQSAGRTDQKAVVEEIRAVLAQHDKALNDKDVDAVMRTYSSNPNTVMMGTGAEEKWVGPQEIRTAYTEIMKDYDPGTLQTNCDWKTGGVDADGNMAWLAAICDAKDSLKGKTRDYKLNVSGGMEKQDGNWRFVVLHMSNAFAPPPVTK
jgi:ketosteroid isomerase-like protein